MAVEKTLVCDLVPREKRMNSKHMSAADWRQLELKLMETVDAAMQSTPDTRVIDAFHEGYQIASDKHGQRMLVKKSPATPFHEFLALRKSSMSLDDYIELSYCDTTDDLRRQQALFYGTNLVNATVLASHETRTSADSFRYVGLKYKQLRFAISDGGVCEPRDTAYAEVSGHLTNKAGQRVIYVVRESVDLDDCPPIDHVVRFHFKTMILQTQCDGYVEDAVYLSANPLGKIPAFIFNKVTQASLTITHDFPTMLLKKRTIEALHTCAKPITFDTARAVVDAAPSCTLFALPNSALDVAISCVENASWNFLASCPTLDDDHELEDGSPTHRSTVSTSNDLDLIEANKSFLERATADFDKMQLAIDEQKQLVDQMKRRLEHQSVQ
ncbi:hypothetical protein Ae201684P_016289 [Aphanomyces euteiches]|nr:hypothetical protein Ae201684P_016289 [Aphanomyces euteiches]